MNNQDEKTDSDVRRAWIKPVVVHLQAGAAENVDGNSGNDGTGTKGS